MKVLIVGGSGLVGRKLVEVLQHGGHEVAVSGRSEARLRSSLPAGVGCVEWDPNAAPIPAAALAGVDAVVNLAGEPVAKGRWTKAKKERIRASRVDGTRHLVEGMAAAPDGPRVLVSASAIGWYGDTKHNWVTEDAAPADDFLGEVCQAWEAEARRARDKGIRTAIVRVGVVLAKEGAYRQMTRPFRMFVGGKIGLGKRWMSWIHVDDAAGLFAHCAESEEAVAVYNATAPNPVSNEEFTDTVAQVLKRPAVFPVPPMALHVILGGFATVVTSSQRVRPLRTIGIGYEFRFPRLEEAIRDLEGKPTAEPVAAE